MHLKLGLMKIFVKAMNQEEAAFIYLTFKSLLVACTNKFKT